MTPYDNRVNVSLRIPKPLREKLAVRAYHAKLSLNDYIKECLERHERAAEKIAQPPGKGSST